VVVSRGSVASVPVAQISLRRFRECLFCQAAQESPAVGGPYLQLNRLSLADRFLVTSARRGSSVRRLTSHESMDDEQKVTCR
jgi:hypothetical protein